MKKTLLAMALSAAVAPAAFAQTNVTLYGIVDAGVEYARVSSGAAAPGISGAEGSAIRVSPGIQSGNRWGLRGTEDLGGGMRAIFTLEAGFNIDDGAFTTNGGGGSAGFGRRSFVGLEGGFGQVFLGRDYTPGFWVALNSDRMQFGMYGNAATLTQIVPTNNTRTGSALFYVSPKFGGLTIRAALGAGQESFGNDAGPNYRGQSLGRFAGVAAEYAQGPLYVGAAFQTQRVARPTLTSLSNDDDSRFWIVGASYNFGAFGINAGFSRNDPAGATAGVPAGVATAETTGYWVGAGVKLGAGDLLAQVGRVRADLAAGQDPRANVWGVAYTHPLSRRTNAYVAYGTVRNNGAGTFGLDTASYAVGSGARGSDPTAFAVGVRHTF